MSATRRGLGVDAGTWAVGIAAGLAAFAIVVVWFAVTTGSALAEVNPNLPRDPFDVFFGSLRGSYRWPAQSTWIVIGVVLFLIGAGLLVFKALGTLRRGRRMIDRAAVQMGRGRVIDALTETGARRTATQLGVTDWVGVPIGLTVHGRKRLYASPEDMVTTIAGPRTGKSTSLVVPAILSAPGAVITTSNKRDVLDTTRAFRAERGRVWAFDPQQVALQPPDWWWNPLSYVTNDLQAAKLAEHFASGSRSADARTDAYFDAAGQDLLAGFLLAAAVDKRPVTDVFTWTTQPGDDVPVGILRRNGYLQMADAVASQVYGEPRRRDSVYGTASQMAACLKIKSIAAWVTPQGEDGVDLRPQFDPASFVGSRDTLYSLSREGKGTAGPLVTALTAATIEAAEQLAVRSPGGRLRVPLLGVLDEAANVCRWRELPALYSHYGSRGIVLITILQSWSQGVDVWGRDGMRTLWSASNVAIYGGGVKEPEFLSELSQMIGDYERDSHTVSSGRGGQSVSRTQGHARILDIADLAALPRGRAVVIASGTPAVLVETEPWMSGPHAAAIRAALAEAQPSVGG
ncbi:type IV secretory system conjugative DNA transfer family protein [Naasia lichenicola]|uniref:Type IV secretory system conjugative DNA transfer family protein n=1 Tax=Naasia lichenicola TaxID=2565933 RepID=A0A4S4FGC1_9MICO|nr:TraM recognition domain-containing protein [Naasia lichenicola]THG29289.1 type IV secretory system conjugative DNA transfer family protein [Naasia lichenicola]